MRFVSHLSCPTCSATYPADRIMNLCEQDGRPVQVVLDIDRLRSERGRDGGWDPSRLDLWRFGGCCRSTSPTPRIAVMWSPWEKVIPPVSLCSSLGRSTGLSVRGEG